MFGSGYGVGELHIPMHSTAKGLVLRMSASAQAEMLSRRSFGTRHVISGIVDKPPATCHPVRSIFGNFDRSWPLLIDLAARFNSTNSIAKCPRRTSPDGLDDFVH